MIFLTQLLADPEISIIIPTYNGEKYITGSINSAIKQNASLTELIVVNDGSKDNTHQVILDALNGTKWRLASYVLPEQQIQNDDNKSYNYFYFVPIKNDVPPIKYVQLINNHGTLYARSIGSLFAQKFLMFIDSDDEFVPGIINSAYKKQLKSKADIVMFGANKTELNNKQNQVPLTFPSYFDKIAYSLEKGFSQKIISSVCKQIWGLLIRTSLYHKTIQRINIIASNKMTHIEDMFQLCSMFAFNFSIIGLNKIGYIYYVNTDSVMRERWNLTQEYLQTTRIVLELNYFMQYVGSVVDNFMADSSNGYTYKDIIKTSQFDCNYQTDLVKRQRNCTLEATYCKSIYNLADTSHFLPKCYYKQFQSNWSNYYDSKKVPMTIEFYQQMDPNQIFVENLSLNETFELVDKLYNKQRHNATDVELGQYVKVDLTSNPLLLVSVCNKNESSIKQIANRIQLFLQQHTNDEQQIEVLVSVQNEIYKVQGGTMEFQLRKQLNNNNIRVVNSYKMYIELYDIQRSRQVYYLKDKCFVRDELFFFMNDIDMGAWIDVKN